MKLSLQQSIALKQFFESTSQDPKKFLNADQRSHNEASILISFANSIKSVEIRNAIGRNENLELTQN